MTKLHKMIDGVQVECSECEERAIKATWEFNKKYVGYEQALILNDQAYAIVDDKNLAKYDLEKAKEICKNKLCAIADQKLEALNKKLYEAILDDDVNSITVLREQRKNLQMLKECDLSKCLSIDVLYEIEKNASKS